MRIKIFTIFLFITIGFIAIGQYNNIEKEEYYAKRKKMMESGNNLLENESVISNQEITNKTNIKNEEIVEDMNEELVEDMNEDTSLLESEEQLLKRRNESSLARLAVFENKTKENNNIKNYIKKYIIIFF